MYLKSLVLKGFKSFADRSALTLEPGITAVVGPNGSGKSNISDAVLWVLGERNAKNLRGQAMEDVIFAGSSARKASGLAEVDLVLDNSDGTLPVDFDEVAITRRMYRNGESEYLINGTVARRMDVLDILHDSGLGTGTHSIISQGSLDSILQSKPEDRRALIEEAAGVLKHKQRKAKSERKLANMDQHLLRARDVVGEVARQLGPLERKAKKARTYQELAAQQAEMSLTIAVDDLHGLQKEWDAAKAREAALAAELEERRGAIQEAEAAVEALQERIRQQTLDAGDLSRRHRAAATAVERFDSAAMMLRERRRAATARAGELELSIEANAVKADEAASELARATAQYEEAAGELDAAKKKVSDLDAVYRDLGVRRGALERELSALSKDAEKMTAERETARRRHAENTEALSHGLAHVQVVEGRAAELALELARAQEEAERAAAGAAEADGELSALVADEGLPVNLTVSLHAPNDEERQKIMPVAKRFSVKEILAACDDYFSKTGRRYIFEYVLIAGETDGKASADALVSLLKGKPCHVNLIRLNEVKERKLLAATDKQAYAFLGRLERGGLSATLRRRMGADIEGACGQLRQKYIENGEEF